MKLKIRLAKNDRDMQEISKIKEEVFEKEQGVSKKLNFEGDEQAEHFICLIENKAIGCARISFFDNKAKLERIAIVKKYRGKGFGKDIVEYLVNYCKDKVNEVYLHAQYHLKDFYLNLGFKTKGKPFYEAGIKHIEMFKFI